jgi:hypothetical protein
MASADIDSFLSDERRAGRHESTGQFTLDAARAIARLEGAGLENPTDYLALMLRAASLLGAVGVEVNIGVREVRARWSFPHHPYVSADRLADALHRGEGFDEASRLLGLTLVTAGGREVEWSLGVGHYLRLLQGRLECGSASLNGPDMEGTLTVRRTGNLLRQLFQARDRAEEQRVLDTRGRYSHVAITVDRRPIARGWPRSVHPYIRGQWTDYMTVAHYYLMEGYVGPSNRLPAFTFPLQQGEEMATVSQEAHSLYRNNRFLLMGDYYEQKPRRSVVASDQNLLEMDTLFQAFLGVEPGQSVGAAFALPMTLSGQSQLILLLDGVATQPKAVDLGLPMLCVASARGLKTDISSLSVVEDEAYRQRLDALREAATGFITVARSQSSHYLLRRQDFSLARKLGQRVPEPLYAKEIREGILRRLG